MLRVVAAGSLCVVMFFPPLTTTVFFRWGTEALPFPPYLTLCKDLLGPLAKFTTRSSQSASQADEEERFLCPGRFLSGHYSHLLSFHASFSFSTRAYRCKFHRWAYWFFGEKNVGEKTDR